MTTPVLLLHGLWMGRPAMLYLRRRLRDAGFAPLIHGYPTIVGDPQRVIDELIGRWRGLAPGPVHAIGHSLGGLTLLAALAQDADLPPGRILCLGSPLAGSSVARRLARSGWTRWAVGQAAARLDQPARIPADREVAMIAGDRAVGLGQWLGRLPQPHDGTVAVAETRVPGLQAHRVIHASHTGLVFSAEVADACERFLKNGHFAQGDR